MARRVNIVTPSSACNVRVTLERALPARQLRTVLGILAASMPMVARMMFALLLLAAPLAMSAQDPAAGPPITVVGAVYDSVANRPLEGAVVQVVRTTALNSAHSAITDSRGRYRIDGVHPGEYLVSFFHPSVDSLAVQAPVRRVTLGARDPQVVDLGLPGAERVIAALCPGLPPFDSSSVIVGEVRDADTGSPIAGATVVADWVDFVLEKREFRIEPQRAAGRSALSGSFALCGVPGGGDVAMRATWNGRASGRLEVPLASRSIVRRDFTLGEGTTFLTIAGEPVRGQTRMDTLWRGPARLNGTVLNEAGQPIADAIVELWETGLTSRTDASGRFELASLPVGTHALEVRRIGFAPQRLPVHLASRAPTSVSVQLDKPVRLLDAVRVIGADDLLAAPDRDRAKTEPRTGTLHHARRARAVSCGARHRCPPARSGRPSVLESNRQCRHGLTWRVGCVRPVQADGLSRRASARIRGRRGRPRVAELARGDRGVHEREPNAGRVSRRRVWRGRVVDVDRAVVSQVAEAQEGEGAGPVARHTPDRAAHATRFRAEGE